MFYDEQKNKEQHTHSHERRFHPKREMRQDGNLNQNFRYETQASLFREPTKSTGDERHDGGDVSSTYTTSYYVWLAGDGCARMRRD